jgi:GNAT superfamily N-acetyltransferase
VNGVPAEIRLAVEADRPAIERIVHDAYAKYIPRIGKPPGPMLDDYAQRIITGQAWVLAEAGAIVGVLVLVPEPDYLLLDNIAVASDQQGRGYGRRLLAFADDEAVRRGYRELRLYTHEKMHENLAIYRAHGWEEYARANEAGYDRIFMVKRLTGVASDT